MTTASASTTPQSGGFRDTMLHAWHEGMVQHVVVTSRSGRRSADLPLAVVIGLGVTAPWVAAAGAVLAVATGGKISTERHEDAPELEGAEMTEPEPTDGADLPPEALEG